MRAILGLMRMRAESTTVAQFVKTLRSTGKTPDQRQRHDLADEIERILADDAEEQVLQLLDNSKR